MNQTLDKAEAHPAGHVFVGCGGDHRIWQVEGHEGDERQTDRLTSDHDVPQPQSLLFQWPQEPQEKVFYLKKKPFTSRQSSGLPFREVLSGGTPK